MKPVQIKKTDLHLIADPSNWTMLGLDPNKGLGIIGNIGVGKTTVINQLLNHLWYDPLRSKVYAGHRLSQLDLKPNWEKTYAGYESIKHTYLLIDDLAERGRTRFNHYGTENNPVADLISLRYYLWDSIKVKKTTTGWHPSAAFNYFTSNYSLETLAEELGATAVDRLHQLCNFVYVGGTSYRSGNLNGVITP